MLLSLHLAWPKHLPRAAHLPFPQVRIVRKVDSGEVLAMKIMKKTAMMRKNQIGHIKAERDAMVCFQWAACAVQQQQQQHALPRLRLPSVHTCAHNSPTHRLMFWIILL